MSISSIGPLPMVDGDERPSLDADIREAIRRSQSDLFQARDSSSVSNEQRNAGVLDSFLRNEEEQHQQAIRDSLASAPSPEDISVELAQLSSNQSYMSEKQMIIEHYQREQRFRDEKEAIISRMMMMEGRTPGPSPENMEQPSVANLLHPRSQSMTRTFPTSWASNGAVSENGITRPASSTIGFGRTMSLEAFSRPSTPGVVQISYPASHIPPAWANPRNRRPPTGQSRRGTTTTTTSSSSATSRTPARQSSSSSSGDLEVAPTSSVSSSSSENDAQEPIPGPPALTPTSSFIAGLEEARVESALPVSPEYETEEKYKNIRLIIIVVGVALLGLGIGLGVGFGVHGGSRKGMSPSSATGMDEGELSVPSTSADESSKKMSTACNIDFSKICQPPDVTFVVPKCAQSRYQDLMHFQSTFMELSQQPCDASSLALLSLATWKAIHNPRNYFLLATIYFSTVGHNWRVNSGWLQDNNVCKWHGVECSRDNSVIALDLAGNNLRGSLPTEIGLFSSLQRITLDHNEIGGPIPTQIGNLNQLKKFSAVVVQLEKQIPTEFGKCQKLAEIRIYSLAMLSTIPSELGDLSNSLTSLHLGGNVVSGTIPSELGTLSKLQSITLDSSLISGTFPTQLGRLTSLEEAKLHAGLVNGAFPTELTRLTNLVKLRIEFSTIKSAIPSSIAQLSSLKILVLSKNRMTGTLPTQLGLMTNLEQLVWGEQDTTGPIPTQLGNLSNLVVLTMWNMRLTGTIPSELGQLTKLQRLLLENNRLTGTLPTEVCPFEFIPTFALDFCTPRNDQVCIQNAC